MNRRMAILCLLIIIMSSGAVLAHPGRTDKYGGHYDQKTGTYHYHGIPGTSSYTISTTAVDEPVVTIDDLMLHLQEARLEGDLDRAMTLCDQIKTALAVEMSEMAALRTPDTSQTSGPLTSPASLDVGSGIVATVTFPTATAYTTKYLSHGDRYGSIRVDIPNAMSLDNKLFKVGQAILSATFHSNNPKVISVSDRGSLSVQGPGESVISVTIEEATLSIPLRVVELPFSSYPSRSEIATAMGFPDAVKQYLSGELWFWTKYPDMCLQMTSYGAATIHSSWDGAFDRVWSN